MESVLLVGAEQLSSAMYSLQEVAEKMQNAASTFDYAIQRHQQFMDDWLCRLEQVMEKKP